MIYEIFTTRSHVGVFSNELFKMLNFSDAFIDLLYCYQSFVRTIVWKNLEIKLFPRLKKILIHTSKEARNIHEKR